MTSPASEDHAKQRPAGPIGSRRSLLIHPRETSLWLKIVLTPVFLFSSSAAVALLVTFTAAVTEFDADFSWLIEAVHGSPTLEVISGRVVEVADGDTLTIRVAEDDYRIRLYEIDTPENGQPWARQAKNALSRKISQQDVTVEVITTDQYGRLVGKIWLDNRDIGREMVAEGHAWAFRPTLDDRSLLRAEANAKATGIGLWSKPNPIPPWEWRQI